MALLNEAYGENYKNETEKMNLDRALNVIINNISHREFVKTLDDCSFIWNYRTNNIDSNVIDIICSRVNTINSYLIIKHINILDPIQKKILPFLLEDTLVEYFYIIDKEMKRYYFIFITPTQIGVY